MKTLYVIPTFLLAAAIALATPSASAIASGDLAGLFEQQSRK